MVVWRRRGRVLLQQGPGDRVPRRFPLGYCDPHDFLLLSEEFFNAERLSGFKNEVGAGGQLFCNDRICDVFFVNAAQLEIEESLYSAVEHDGVDSGLPECILQIDIALVRVVAVANPAP